MSLKPSRYNFFVPYKDHYLLYNTRTNALAVVDEEMKESLESFDQEVILQTPEEELNIMKERGFLLESGVDELLEVKYRHFKYIINNFNNLVELTLVMTYKCNLACTYCYEKGITLTRSMDTPTLDIVTKYIKTQAVGERYKKLINILFYGGEPLLNWKGCKYVLDFLSECHTKYRNPIETRLVTNGVLLTDRILQEFRECNVVLIQMTLDGAKKDHDQRRKTHSGKGTYDIIMDRITRVYEIDKELPHIRINIDSTNYHNIPLLFDDLSERGLTDISVYFGMVQEFSIGCRSGDASCFDLKDMQDVLPELWRLARSKGFIIKTRPTITPVYCMFDLAHAFVIDPFGDFYNCWDAVGIKDFCIGSLDEKGTLQPNKNFYHALSRDPTTFRECKTCPMLPVCMGGCAFLSYRIHGNFHSAGCGDYKKIIGDRLKWYVEREYAHKLGGRTT